MQCPDFASGGVNSRPPGDSRAKLEGSPVGRLSLSLYPRDPCGREFMILTVYCDESGTHGGSPCTVLAGFLGDANEWVEFEREWTKVLRKHQISHVHAKHLWHRQKEFKGWSETQVRRLWADLWYVIQEHKRVFAARTALREEDYKLFYVSDGPAPKERLDSRYALCFRAFMSFHPAFHRTHFTSGSAIRTSGPYSRTSRCQASASLSRNRCNSVCDVPRSPTDGVCSGG